MLPAPQHAAETAFASRRGGRGPRPDIVFILADDLGWADLGCFGSPSIRTPNLDRLAAEGVRFTHAYAGSSWCSPTRLSLYTGRNPGRLSAGLEEPLRTRADGNGIPAGHPTLPSLLRTAGYGTAMFGKWHCGWLPWYSPLRIGFDVFFGNLDGAMDYFEHIGTLGEPDLYEGETPVEQTGYYTDLISDRAVELIAAAGPEPFYLQLNYTAPHWPWEGRGDAEEGRRIRRDYEQRTVPFPLLHLDGGSLAKYGELVETMDDAIGRVLDALDAAGRRENTIVIFCSDNGGERWSMNWPFVGEKGDLTEGGVRVPFILRWPAAVGPHQVSDAPTITMDWTATLLDAAGTGPDPAYPLDGVSLLPWLVEGAAFPDHDLFWRISSQGALRRGRWKYVRDGRERAVLGNWPRRPGTFELLYDVTVDGREAADVARHHPELVAELRDAWDRIDATLLPYPPEHPGLPRHARPGRPAVSQPD
ncbi:MAG: sulfatase-like hydrolase/transferase [Acidimicrobiia bacterium]